MRVVIIAVIRTVMSLFFALGSIRGNVVSVLCSVCVITIIAISLASRKSSFWRGTKAGIYFRVVVLIVLFCVNLLFSISIGHFLYTWYFE